MLPVFAGIPFLRRRNFSLMKDVILSRGGEKPPAIDPSAEPRRCRYVRRRRDDPIGDRFVGTRKVLKETPERFLGGQPLAPRGLQGRGNRDGFGIGPAPGAGQERYGFQERGEFAFGNAEPGARIPFRAVGDVHCRAQPFDLLGGADAGVIVLVARDRQSITLDRIGEKTGRTVVLRAGVEGFEDGFQAVTTQIAHQRVQIRVVVVRQQVANARCVSDVAQDLGAPCAAALKGKRGIEGVGTVVDPFAKRAAAGAFEGVAHEAAVFERYDVPARRAKDAIDQAIQVVGNHAVEALAIVVDDPPAVPKVVFPTFPKRFVDAALIHFGVADQGHHSAPGTALGQKGAVARVFLRHRGEDRESGTESHGTRGNIDVVVILGPGRITLGAAQCAVLLQRRPILPSEQILNGVEHR